MLHRLPPQNDSRETVRNRLVHDYIRALDAGNDDAIDRILDAAVEDPQLDALLSDVDRSLLEDHGLPSAQTDAEVHRTVQLHLTPVADASDPATVGRVAAALKASGRLSAAARDYNATLLTDTTPLPNTFRNSHYTALLTEIASPPPPEYVDAFVSQAGRLVVAAPSAPSLLAARSTRRPS